MTDTLITQDEVVAFNVIDVIRSSTIETVSNPHVFNTESSPEVHTFETSPPKGEKGDPGVVSGQIFEYPVAYPISGHRIVVLNENQEVIYATSANPFHANKVLGITTRAAISGNIGIQNGGVLTEPSWNWILDIPIWLGIDGLMTQIVPVSGFSLIVGFPISFTSILINIHESIFLI